MAKHEQKCIVEWYLTPMKSFFSNQPLDKWQKGSVFFATRREVRQQAMNNLHNHFLFPAILLEMEEGGRQECECGSSE